jgi:hypothetical protein
MSTVFAVHQPARYDQTKRRMVPIDISKAERFGKMRLVFPGLDRPPPVDEAIPTLRTVLGVFKPTDYLVLAGDLDLVVFAAALALNATGGKINLLKWSNRLQDYELVAPCNIFSGS